MHSGLNILTIYFDFAILCMAYFLRRSPAVRVRPFDVKCMKKCRKYRGLLRAILSFAICTLPLVPRASANEQTFPTLQVGTHVYTNVTVTTKAKNYIFILHSTGMENIRVGDLPEEIRTELGYVPEVTKSQKAHNWAKGKMSDFHIAEVKASELKDPKKWREESAVVLEKARSLDSKLCGAILGGVLLLYLFNCYCCMLICRKAGSEPGMLVWLPGFQVFPLLRAAHMSSLWAFASLFFVPGIIAGIVWCFRIADARGKSPFVGVCLLLPVLSLFAFLYLAFSDGAPEPSAPKEDDRTARLMTLETA